MRKNAISLSVLLTAVMLLMLVLLLPVPVLEPYASSAVTDTVETVDKMPKGEVERPTTSTTGAAVVIERTDKIVTRKINVKIAYLVKVSLQKQRISVFKTVDGKSVLIKTMPCATGKKHTPTPKGTFSMKPIGKFLYDKKYNCYLKYVIRFKGSYLIHSVPVSKSGRVLDHTIGKPASHGCIRLLVEDSKWLYQLPAGTKVLIQ